MSAPQTACMAADAETSHPDWCNRELCFTVPNPDHPPTVCHHSQVVTWQTDDQRFELDLSKIDEPADPHCPIGEPTIGLSARSLHRGIRDGDVLFTAHEAMDLVQRLLDAVHEIDAGLCCGDRVRIWHTQDEG